MVHTEACKSNDHHIPFPEYLMKAALSNYLYISFLFNCINVNVSTSNLCSYKCVQFTDEVGTILKLHNLPPIHKLLLKALKFRNNLQPKDHLHAQYFERISFAMQRFCACSNMSFLQSLTCAKMLKERLAKHRTVTNFNIQVFSSTVWSHAANYFPLTRTTAQ